MEYVSLETTTCYFHNLKFDGMFILDWFFRHGFKYTENKLCEHEFNCLISDTGIFYNIKCKIGRSYITFKDSYKVLPMGVEDIPKAFGLEINKLKIDYEGNRELGHELTNDEIDYLRNDVDIVAKALHKLHEQGLKKLTTASNALHDYKKRIGDYFEIWFPKLDIKIDGDCRLSYKGGWTYVNPEKKDINIGKGLVFDINSAYPFVMKNKVLPYGEPIYYVGQYKFDPLYPLFICCIQADFYLKDEKYPSIQLKKNPLFIDTEYITDTKGIVILHLTSVDYDLLIENYNIREIKYINGYKFRGQIGMFDEYITYWYGKKVESKREKNYSYATIAKLMQNSLYGKFGSNPRKSHKIPYFDNENDIVKFKNSEVEEKPDGYVPVASFITSYVRDIIIRGANACGKRFCYADTDSLHIEGDEYPDIWIDEYELGAFKLEGRFTRAKYLRAKCYIETINGDLDKKCAGLPKSCRNTLTYETLNYGMEFYGKLQPKVVPGGVVLIPRIFKIRS